MEPQRQNSQPEVPKLNLSLITSDYFQYKHQPQRYLFNLILEDNPWPHEPHHKLLSFLQKISSLYNPVSYHNLTHAFDVMTSFDQYLTKHGWMQTLQITPHKRIFMLVAAFAHDAAHEGLTNAFYKNSAHPLSVGTVSPLQTMHAGNLKKILRQFELVIPAQILQQLVEMILKTDNFYHGWLLEKIEALKQLKTEELSLPEHSLSMSCILLHAADLNNAAKDFELSIRWTNELYIQFQKQAELQKTLHLPLTFIKPATQLDYINSNISFLDHMIVPLFKGITLLEPKCQEVLQKILNNKQHWLSLKAKEEKLDQKGQE